jgi:phage gpG-like protein
MAGISLEVKGSKKTRERLRKAKRSIDQDMRSQVEATALQIERLAKKTVPVRTGRLRGSIHVLENNGLDATVGTNVEYASYVEARQPYLKPAADEAKAEFEQRVNEILNKNSK